MLSPYSDKIKQYKTQIDRRLRFYNRRNYFSKCNTNTDNSFSKSKLIIRRPIVSYCHIEIKSSLMETCDLASNQLLVTFSFCKTVATQEEFNLDLYLIKVKAYWCASLPGHQLTTLLDSCLVSPTLTYRLKSVADKILIVQC